MKGHPSLGVFVRVAVANRSRSRSKLLFKQGTPFSSKAGLHRGSEAVNHISTC